MGDQLMEIERLYVQSIHRIPDDYSMSAPLYHYHDLIHSCQLKTLYQLERDERALRRKLVNRGEINIPLALYLPEGIKNRPKSIE
jgi:hypothetical protein